MMSESHPVLRRPFAGLYTATAARSYRESSWDRTGANDDWITVGPGETATLLDVSGPGCITHTYCAMLLPRLTDYRDTILRCYWDGSDLASVEVPLGDFFGVAQARVRTLSSQFISVNPGFGPTHGLNSYFAMPFSDGARITLENRGDHPLGGPLQALWYHIDYELYAERLPEETLRFHAGFYQELSTVPMGDEPGKTLHRAQNLDGAENYVALDTVGRGRMVGLLLEIDNVSGGWYGEGDDMVFIDGQGWPPDIHGTGTEEIFGGGACPSVEYIGLTTGFHLVESPEFDGPVGMYRWMAHDPITFQRSVRWTVEHGHANNFANRYESVAYWYQDPIVAGTPQMGSRAELRPRLAEPYEEVSDLLFPAATAAHRAARAADFRDIGIAATPFYEGRFAEALKRLTDVLGRIE
jgi:Protein of unknown function (DUF2961)